jgi:hypothetical protein
MGTEQSAVTASHMLAIRFNYWFALVDDGAGVTASRRLGMRKGPGVARGLLV